MRITIDLKGHYDWAPAPPGTVITQAHVDGLQAKQMSDESWHMRVELDRDTHYDQGIHEESICRQVANAFRKGEDLTRAEVAAAEIRVTYKHHFPRKHGVALHVHDDGPLADLMALVCEQMGFSAEDSSKILSAYTAPEDVGAYCASHLRFKHHKEPNVHGPKHPQTPSAKAKE